MINLSAADIMFIIRVFAASGSMRLRFPTGIGRASERRSIEVGDDGLWFLPQAVVFAGQVRTSRGGAPKMTQQHLDDVAGRSHYLLAADEILQLLELHDNAGRPIIRVIDSSRCELMGAGIEPWRCSMSHLAVRDLWLWRLGDIERPSWLPDGDLDLDSLSDD